MEKKCAREGCKNIIKGSRRMLEKRKYCSHECRGMALGFGKRSTFEDLVSGRHQMTQSERLKMGKDILDSKTSKVDSKGDAGVVGGVLDAPGVRSADLDKIRTMIKKTGHAYKYDKEGNILGEWDKDGSYTEF